MECRWMSSSMGYDFSIDCYVQVLRSRARTILWGLHVRFGMVLQMFNLGLHRAIPAARCPLFGRSIDADMIPVVSQLCFLFGCVSENWNTGFHQNSFRRENHMCCLSCGHLALMMCWAWHVVPYPCPSVARVPATKKHKSAQRSKSVIQIVSSELSYLEVLNVKVC